MEPELIYNIQSGPYWDWKVAADLFLGGAGVGALLFGILLDETLKAKYRRLCQTAAWLGPVMIVAGLAFLLAKLGKPSHIYQMLINFAPTSPLWWGGWFQQLLIAGSAWYALKWLHPSEHDRTRTWLGRLLLPLAVIVGGYHGLLLAVVTARPLWNTGPTVVAAMLSFVTTGIAAVMLVHLVRMKIAGRLVESDHLNEFLHDLKPVRNVVLSVLVLQLGTFFLWWLSLNFGALGDRQALVAANASYGPMFWGLGIGVGLALPLLIGAFAVPRGRAGGPWVQIHTMAWSSVFILVGGFFFRLAVVLGGQAALPIATIF